MDNASEKIKEPANLRFLRILVTILTGTMIAGVVAIIILIVIRVPTVTSLSPKTLPLPAEITLPKGAIAGSFTQGDDWYAVITTDNEILIFDRDDGSLRQSLTIKSR